ncbi:MAG: leucine-rich repeat protein [Bacteroidales bacterium]|nr:leucine-rich repeat protein [Bacteroidales bacterium]
MKIRAVIVLALFCLVALKSEAYDFAIRLNYGDSIYFTIIDRKDNLVKVTAPLDFGIDRYPGRAKPSGTLSIPSSVTYNGVRYIVTTIGTRAFSQCTGITAIILPRTLKTIEAYAFYNCSGIRGRIYIGEGIETIGTSAFYGCNGITEVSFNAINCTQMGSSMSSTVFGNCSNLRRIEIGDKVTSIPDYAFCGVDAISTSVVFPVTLKKIGAYSFAYCTDIPDMLFIPDSVQEIGNNAFYHCHSLTKVRIGRKVAKIGEYAFAKCIMLSEVIVDAFTPPAITSTSFSEISDNVKFSIPCVAQDNYKTIWEWESKSPFKTFGECEFTISATLTDTNSGVVVGVGNYKYGEQVSLVVAPAAGYGFEGWSDGNNDNPRQFTANDNLSVTANMRQSGTIFIRDTAYRVDTFYCGGIKVVHDTVELNDIAMSIRNVPEVTFTPSTKRVTWQLRKGETVESVAVYSPQGECVYSGNGKRGYVDMKRFETGSYIIKIETYDRVIRARFFMSSISGYEPAENETKTKRKQNQSRNVLKDTILKTLDIFL